VHAPDERAQSLDLALGQDALRGRDLLAAVGEEQLERLRGTRVILQLAAGLPDVELDPEARRHRIGAVELLERGPEVTGAEERDALREERAPFVDRRRARLGMRGLRMRRTALRCAGSERREREQRGSRRHPMTVVPSAHRRYGSPSSIARFLRALARSSAAPVRTLVTAGDDDEDPAASGARDSAMSRFVSSSSVSTRS
jgi:hypothetical protein